MALAAMNQVFVVAAHLNDDVRGWGGTFARHADAGDQVQVFIGVEGTNSHQQHRDRIQACKNLFAVAHAAQTVGSILGTAGVDLLGNRLHPSIVSTGCGR